MSIFSFLFAAGARVLLDHQDFFLTTLNMGAEPLGLSLTSYLVYEILLVPAVIFLFMHFLKSYKAGK